ncbi:MAG: hypothetical protein R6V35_03405 [Candidatus Nanohaloarchaea archaeon]
MSFYSDEGQYEDLPLEKAIERASIDGWVEELQSDSPEIPEDYSQTTDLSQ